jgi:two-component system cell cycle sensor histidine kinase/response regulator CckA
MNRRLRILHLEDDPDYCDLVRSLLAEEKLEAEIVLVSTRADFEAALALENFDLILADYLLPNYSGSQALSFARKQAPGTPILVVSGTIGELAAIESLNCGATDYVLKQWSERLVPAIRRAVQEAEERNLRRKIETELIRNEQAYRLIFDGNPTPMWIFDHETLAFLEVNDAALRLYGYSRQEFSSMTVKDIRSPEEEPALVEYLHRLVSGGPPSRSGLAGIWRHRKKDGTQIDVEIKWSPVSFRGRAASLTMANDITERLRAEQALRESEQRFRDLFEGSPDAIFVEDCQGLVLDVNPAACQLHGVTRQELIGKNVSDLVPPDLKEEAIRNFNALVEGKLRQVEGASWTKDQRAISVEVRANRIHYAGKPAVLLHVRDATERKQAEADLRRLEEQLRQAQKMEAIGQLAGGVAHDFNNILTVIHGHASMLLSGGALTGQPARSAQQIVQAAERAAALTRQLLTFSRRQVMQPRRLDVNGVVSNLSKMLGRILGEDITLQLSYSPQPALVQADASMVEQVLLNLAVNSRDAMPGGGQLAIRISVLELDEHALQPHPEARAGQFVCISVTDTGCGISPEHLPRIFEPFFTTKEVGKGTGLGLATVYGIVKQHQGWVEVKSQPGVGSTFSVFMPCLADASQTAASTTAQPVIRGGAETILVVEDEAPVRELVCSFLASHGYRILEADCGAKAIEVWRRDRDKIDLVLTDLVMPDRMNGRELAEKLWADRPKLKVIFTSGYSADVVGKDFVLRRGLNYLQKPYHPDRLAMAVRECLDNVN